jgi:hypothetical protein
MIIQKSLFNVQEKEVSKEIPVTKQSTIQLNILSAINKSQVQDDAMLWLRTLAYKDMYAQKLEMFCDTIETEISIKTGSFPIDLAIKNHFLKRYI